MNVTIHNGSCAPAKRHAWKKPLLCLTAICLLSGCTMLSVRKFVNSFEGLNAAVARSSSAGGTLRILFIHGMGRNPVGYSQLLREGIATRLGLSPAGSLPAIPITKDNQEYGEVNIADYSGPDGKRVRTYELDWTATTEKIKEKQFRTDATYASSRVLVNRSLKAGLIDTALADPVLYIGRYRTHMQYPVMRGVEAVLHDYQPQDELAIVTLSLGSYMCYDTLLKMSRGEPIMGEKGYSTAVVQDLIGHTNYIYMLANQLPLLELSEVSNPLPRDETKKTVKALAEIRRENKPSASLQRQQAPLALHLVAFSDPNDLLSYPLDQDSTSSNMIEYSNVVISVERSAILGVFAWPMTAHTGHGKSKAVMDLLAFGHHETNPKP